MKYIHTISRELITITHRARIVIDCTHKATKGNRIIVMTTISTGYRVIVGESPFYITSIVTMINGIVIPCRINSTHQSTVTRNGILRTETGNVGMVVAVVEVTALCIAQQSTHTTHTAMNGVVTGETMV